MLAAVNPMSYSQVGSHPITSCVKDNVTGLIWEGKEASGLRAGSNAYTNYDSAYYGTQAQMDAVTNTYGYVNYVNSISLCGYNDWRIPSKNELQGIVDYGKFNPAISVLWFPNTPTPYGATWSSTARYEVNHQAWWVDFHAGHSESYALDAFHRAVPYKVRLVRGQENGAGNYNACPRFSTNSRFTLSGSYIQDNVTGLVWERCFVGQNWINGMCSGSASTVSHEQAMALAKDRIGWRIPTIKELGSIPDPTCTNANIGGANIGSFNDIFPNGISIWSSTPFAATDGFSWFGNHNGLIGVGGWSRSNLLNVRLVRTNP
jgi:Protein of unknown function (DUF1566)